MSQEVNLETLAQKASEMESLPSHVSAQLDFQAVRIFCFLSFNASPFRLSVFPGLLPTHLFLSCFLLSKRAAEITLSRKEPIVLSLGNCIAVYISTLRCKLEALIANIFCESGEPIFLV